MSWCTPAVLHGVFHKLFKLTLELAVRYIQLHENLTYGLQAAGGYHIKLLFQKHMYTRYTYKYTMSKNKNVKGFRDGTVPKVCKQGRDDINLNIGSPIPASFTH